MARRFIVSENNIKKINENEIIIYGDEVKHIQVLRFNIGDEININNKIYKIIEMKRDSVKLNFKNEADSIGIPNINLKLYIAILKGEKMDLVIQKAVEIGACEIITFFSKNTVVKLDEKECEKKKLKYEKIVIEAEKQCGRTDSVKVHNFMNFNEVLNDIKSNDINFFAYEKSNTSLKETINSIDKESIKNIGIIVGAEGGFTDSENESLSSVKNVKNISLGSRILRAETAAINLCSIIMYEFD